MIEFIGFDNRIWFKINQKVLALAPEEMWQKSFCNNVKVLDDEGYPIESCNFSEEERKVIELFENKIFNKMPCHVTQEWEISDALKKLI